MPHQACTPIAILMADDDADDREMTAEAFRDCQLNTQLLFVENGEQLMDYLHRRGPYANEQLYPMPGLILLDLNMPCKDGREALREIKTDPVLKQIPVVVLTTTSAEEDIALAYHDGVNSFITKPVSFQGLVDVVATLGRYWLHIVDLPGDAAEQRG